MNHIWTALRYASTMPVRIMLMCASYLWSFFLLIAPDRIMRFPTYQHLLSEGGKYGWAAFFFLNGTLLLWRIVDLRPRAGVLRLINALSCCLWAAYVGTSIASLGYIKPDLADPIVFLLSAGWLTLRTDLTISDRATA